MVEVVGAVRAAGEREPNEVAAVGVGEREPAEFHGANAALAVELTDERLPGELLAWEVGSAALASM